MKKLINANRCEGGKVWSEVGDVAVKCAASLVSYKELTQITRRRIKSYKTWHSNLQRQLKITGCCGYRENNSPFLDRKYTSFVANKLPNYWETGEVFRRKGGRGLKLFVNFHLVPRFKNAGSYNPSRRIRSKTCK